MKPHPLRERLLRIAHAFYKDLDSPVSLGCWLRLKYGEDLQLAEMSIKPDNYLTCARFETDYAAVNWLRKSVDLETGINLKEVATRKFITSEQECFRTNERFRSYDPNCDDPYGRTAVISKAARKIRRLIGAEVPDSLFNMCAWGPGATASLKGSLTPEDKITEARVSVTPDCQLLASHVLGQDLFWTRARGIDADAACCWLPTEFQQVSGSRYLTVPKDARSDRSICAEPTANIFLQKAVGSFFRSRLKKVGVDLDDQTLNQKLAAQAYVKNLATIDLSSASDSVAIEVVRALLPLEWLNLLEILRCPSVLIEGRTLRLQKFSSMGNGFTFELESLIFWALLASCGEPNPGVYGDDLIVRQASAERCISVLSEFGFRTNLEKTFIKGSFFESCGHHFFRGVLVTPPYQKESLYGQKGSFERAITLAHNRLYRWWDAGLFHTRGLGLDHADNLRVVRTLRQLSEKPCFQPAESVADTGFITHNLSELTVVRRTRYKLTFRGWRFFPKGRIPPDPVGYAYSLRFGGSSRSLRSSELVDDPFTFYPRQQGTWRIAWCSVFRS
ncbi:TPA_asm: RNA-directed RNA polymerase [ssRNA phage SRR6960803_8]|uniref:RNA-directed RNA polymerase n=1 Tax=ssRNA phage SRR6960803_8 TaxID=2786624 RepID=A0A8S5KY96_9VIRU|nr:RNA-directed RNA polymerase [ssRNA phage SRR6960803_8]DAD50750.1 TPA_asm: RNA-directed RNA polymerase [ssRNA phage SRR6960803_8]